MKQPLKQILKPILFLAMITLVCGFLARSLANAETLADRAENHNNADETYPDDSTHIDEKENEEEKEREQVQKDTIQPEVPSENKKTDSLATDNNDTGDTTAIAVSDTEKTEDLPDGYTVYREGFTYCELTDEVKNKITGISYPVSASEISAPELATPESASPGSAEPDASVPAALNVLEDNTTPAISYEDLRYLTVLYYDFNGEVQSGELICNKGIVQDLVEIFYELYENEYQIEKIRLIDEYQGDDTASMADNNTSCFNYRVVDGTSSLSKHALGCAIDINPFYNPYVVFNKNGSGETYISPAGSETYADRSKDFPYKIDENDLCYQLFKEHGFVWGGNWNSCKDYQHFQKVVE